MQGDLVYLAPETHLAMNGEQVPITPKIDVFAMGLLVHQLWTSVLPRVDSRYDYAFEAVLNGDGVQIDARIPRDMRHALHVNPLATATEEGCRALWEAYSDDCLCWAKPGPVVSA